jgi:sulfur carrier protein
MFMILVFINGQALQVDENLSLQQLLMLAAEPHLLDLANIAVAFNQHIVPKSQWSEQGCREGDHIDVFSAVAGG